MAMDEEDLDGEENNVTSGEYYLIFVFNFICKNLASTLFSQGGDNDDNNSIPTAIKVEAKVVDARVEGVAMVTSLCKLKRIQKEPRQMGPPFGNAFIVGGYIVGNNATKAILHVLRIKGQQNSRGCSAQIQSIFVC